MIQFQCPGCQAQLRVPDNAIGKTVNCPKCSHALIVPAPPKERTSSPPPQIPTSDAILGSGEIFDPNPSQERPESAQQAVGELLTVVTHDDHQPIENDPLLVTVRKSQRSNGTAITSLIFIGITIAGIWGLNRYLHPPMRGTLPGTIVDSNAIPDLALSRADIDAPEQLDAFVDEFPGQEIKIQSQILRATWTVFRQGWEISLEAGKGVNLVRVSVLENKPLYEFHKLGYAQLNQRRKRALEVAAKEFLTQAVESEEYLENDGNLAQCRDQVLIPAAVSGLGYSLVAIVDDVEYPCVWQDKEDHLYFVVPYQAESFRIQERSWPDGSSEFPQDLEFEVELPDTEK